MGLKDKEYLQAWRYSFFIDIERFKETFDESKIDSIGNLPPKIKYFSKPGF